MRTHPEQKLLFPALAGFAKAAEDVASVRASVKKLRLIGKVESFEPLGHLRNLRFLSLTNISTHDRSLEPLQNLRRLDELSIANLFDAVEFARLSAALPGTRCDWFKPLLKMKGFPCKSCRRDTVMLTGKGKTTLCPRCHKGRIQRHVEAFREAAAGAG